MGGNSETMEVEENASHALGLSIVEYRELVAIIKSRTISENAQGAEGDECSLFDGLKAKEIVDEELMELETMQAILDAIEMNYCNLRERRKPFFRDLITLKISGLFAEDERTIRMLCKKEFFNKELYTKCVDGSITARYIAEQYSIKEQSVSRAWKKFKKKVAYNIKG